jgi:DNA repair exonuclease SbcCD ATPase subunit
LKLLRISWKNIGPYGNKLQTLEFDPKGGLWMVVGKNGHGKSFLVNLPKILYYGKLDKFKKEDIGNRLNKHGWIWGETEIRPGEYVDIERRFAPSDLGVSKGNLGEEKDDIGKSGISNYQDYIDTEITGLPYHIFSNIISLSVNDFKSFISMTPGDKRIIIDKLFSMEILNRMNDLVRKDLRESKISIDIYDREISSLQDTIKSANKELEKLKERVKEDNTKKIAEITEKMMAYKPKLEEAQEKLEKWKAKKVDIEKGYNVFHRKSGQIETELKEIKKKIRLYHSDKCPTCETPFSESRFELIRGDLEGQQKEKENELEDLKINEKKYESAYIQTKEAIKKLTDFILQVKSSYTTLYNELNKLKGDKPKEFDSIKNIISKNTEKIQKKEVDKLEVDDQFKHLLILEELYSDKGVKKRILESYLPTLNREVEYTLNELHFPYRLRFTNDFDPIMEHLGLEVNVETLSTGEKKRVDLAVLISIIRMIKRKYPTLNIFMLDEVLSSIDGDGIYDIIGLLQKTSKELSLNIFIINHSPLPVEYFDYRVEIQKNDGFSDLKIEKFEVEDLGDS